MSLLDEVKWKTMPRDIKDPRPRPLPDEPEQPGRWRTVTVVTPGGGLGTMRVDADVLRAWDAENAPYIDPATGKVVHRKPYSPTEVPPLRRPVPKGTSVKPTGKSGEIALTDVPNAFMFIVEFAGKPPTGRNIAMRVIGHKVGSSEDVLSWINELLKSQGVKFQYKKLDIPYQDFTSKGRIGRAMKDYGASEVTGVFDTADAFIQMLDRVPAVAKTIMRSLRGQRLSSGELRATLLRYVR